MTTCTEQHFLNDVSGHTMKVVHDNGVHRHLRFDNNGSAICHFNITTWPGYLCVSGDMGCYVFARIPDMFLFFRSDNDKLTINPDYWSEKCYAIDKNGLETFNPETLKARIRAWMDDCSADEELRTAVERNVMCAAHDGEHEAISAAMSFSHHGCCVFQDFWEVNCKEYTFQFIWCCYAIVWGIRQYDQRAGTD